MVSSDQIHLIPKPFLIIYNLLQKASLPIYSIDTNSFGNVVFSFAQEKLTATIILEKATSSEPQGPSVSIDEDRLTLITSDFSQSVNSHILFTLEKLLQDILPTHSFHIFKYNDFVDPSPLESSFFLFVFSTYIEKDEILAKSWKIRNLKYNNKTQKLTFVLEHNNNKISETIEINFTLVSLQDKQAKYKILQESKIATTHRGIHNYIKFLLCRKLNNHKVYVNNHEDITPIKNSLLDNFLTEFAYTSSNQDRFFSPWGNTDSFMLEAECGYDPKKATLMHVSRECAMGCNILSGYINTGMRPWDNSPSTHQWNYSNQYVTDIDKQSALFGGEQKIVNFFQSIKGVREYQLITYFQGCDYHMIHDNISSTCNSCNKNNKYRLEEIPYPLPSVTMSLKRNWWYRSLESSRIKNTLKKVKEINLIGYNHIHSDEIAELDVILKNWDISINTALLPSSIYENANSFFNTSMNCVSPWMPIIKTWQPILEHYKIKYITPNLPYGIKGTVLWTQAILDYFGIKEDQDIIFEKLKKHIQLQSHTLQQNQSSKKPVTIGIAYERGSIRELANKTFFYGFEIFPYLQELGVNIVVINLNPQNYNKMDEYFLRCLDGLSDVSYRLVQSHDSIIDIFSDSEVNFLYCEQQHGKFAKRNKLIPISIKQFHMGIKGFAKTAQWLHAASLCSFYKRHSQWLPT